MNMRYLLLLLVLGTNACNISRPSAQPSATHEERVIRIRARRYEYSPSRILLKKGEPILLEFESLDHPHGFAATELGLRTDIEPGQVARLRFVPDRVGSFEFHCDVFCGSGHEDMSGEIVVEE